MMLPNSGDGGKYQWLLVGRRAAAENGRGVIGSLLLHGLAALLVFFIIAKTASQAPQKAIAFVPVDLVRLGLETQSPAETRKALVPQEKASAPHTAASPSNEAVAPNKIKPAPEDALEAKLKALARLAQPPSDLKIEGGQGVSNLDAGNGSPGERAIYSVKDYVRAQVLRRWSLNLAKMAGRDFIIPIRIAMKRDGTIVSAEIVEQARAKTNALYRDIALSARNAVILSSPIALPPADLPAVMHFTLNLDPKETQR